MRIKVYIVTYNNNYVLNDWCLKTLFDSDITKHDHEITIINNHSNIKINDEYIDKVTVLNNVLRLDRSSAHLSRSWNQALINGFKSLNNPDCDIVVCVQNDEKLKPNWVSNILKYHEKYSFIGFGAGDSFMSFKAEAVKKIGLFDERFFCGKQEHDYFLRAFIHNRDKSSFNDKTHGYIWNPLNNNIIEDTPCGNDPRRETQAKVVYDSYKDYSKYPRNLFMKKWGFYDWGTEYITKCNTDKILLQSIFEWIPKPLIFNYMYYPYFEKDIEDLEGKNYAL